MMNIIIALIILAVAIIALFGLTRILSKHPDEDQL